MVDRFGRCLTIDGNKQTENIGTGLEQKLAILASQITDVQQKVSATGHVQIQGEETIVKNELESKSHAAHILAHVEAAQEVFSTGSVYAGSFSGTAMGGEDHLDRVTEAFGSVLGLDEQHRRRIDNWLPGKTLSESTEFAYPFDSRMLTHKLSRL